MSTGHSHIKSIAESPQAVVCMILCVWMNKCLFLAQAVSTGRAEGSGCDWLREGVSLTEFEEVGVQQ